MMTLNDWLEKIQCLHPDEIELGLARISMVAERLNLLHPTPKVITLAGTNGKGTTTALLETVLHRHGFKVGAYTSPHLLKFNERIRINTQEIEDEKLVTAFEHVEQARNNIKLTFFEFTTLAALYCFQNIKLDYILLEVGLGGRLDAVNCIDSDYAVITTIDLDHCDWLGPTREHIAAEKAGIFRENKPVICGESNPPATLINHAKQLNTKAYYVGKQFHYTPAENDWKFYTDTHSIEDLPVPNMPIANAATAIQTLSTVLGFENIKQTILRDTLNTLSVPGRMMRLQTHCPILLDVAHNPQACHYLNTQLAHTKPAGKILAVWSMLSDKALTESITPLMDKIEAWYVAPLNAPRAANINVLTDALSTQQANNIYPFESLPMAFEHAKSHATPDDLIVVFGSFYTLAEILSCLNEV